MAFMIPSMMEAVSSKMTTGQSVSLIKDSDTINRMSYKASPIVFGASLLIIIYMQFIENPMVCLYTEAKFEWQAFIDNFCWLESYYHPDIKQKLVGMQQLTHQMDSSIVRYATFQWVPFIIVIQLFLFYLPHLVWETIFLRSSLNPKDLLRVAMITSVATTAEERSIKLKELCEIFNPLIEIKDDGSNDTAKKNKMCCKCSAGKILRKHRGIFLVGANYLIKLLYIANAVGQIILVTVVYQTSSVFYGIDVFIRLYKGMGSEMPEAFPRIVYCKLVIQEQIAKPIQCASKLNLFNEKLYTFHWFWCASLAICGGVTLIYDILRQATLTTTKGFIYKDLKLLRDKETKENRLRALVFVRGHMRRDGIHMLDLINNQISQLVVGELVIALWKDWVEHLKKKIDADSESVASEELIEQVDTNCIEVDKPISQEDPSSVVIQDETISHGKFNEGAQFDTENVTLSQPQLSPQISDPRGSSVNISAK